MREPRCHVPKEFNERCPACVWFDGGVEDVEAFARRIVIGN